MDLRAGYSDLTVLTQTTERVTICAKEVPTSLALMGMGSGVAMSNPRPLMEMGVPMKTTTYSIDESGRSKKETYDFVKNRDQDSIWTIFKPSGDSEEFDLNDFEYPRQNERDPLKAFLKDVTGPGVLGPSYTSDVFYNLTLLSFAQDADLNKRPELVFYPSDVNRLTDAIRVSHFKGYTGKERTRLKWFDLADIDIKIDFLLTRTFWGHKLSKMITDSEDRSIQGWSRCLRKKIKWLLKGRGNPRWTREYLFKVYANPDEVRNLKSRAGHFIEMLKTIDGAFIGRFLAFPNEIWNWNKFDLFVLEKMSNLIDDLFYDGHLLPEAWNYVTKYSELKRVRKTFKMYSHRKEWSHFEKRGQFDKETPAWLRHLGQLFYKVGEVVDPTLQAQMIGLLSQTRGAGKPPQLDVLKAEKKFLETVSKPPERLRTHERAILRASVTKAINAMPDAYFTGLSTKARVNVQNTACYERTRAEGGTEAAVASLVWDGTQGVTANILDLETGEKLGEIKYKSSTEGEYIFWRCLEIVVTEDPDDITTSFVTMIKEPGKGRTVTKGAFALKVVLDVVNKICSWPLTKVESSRSGMGKEAHGWNFFQSLYSSGHGTSPFRVHKVLNEREVGNLTEKLIEYQDLYVECTDYSEATDNLQHEIAKEIAIPWMRRCGIPKLLQQIVLGATLSPKIIEFTGFGLMENIGEPHKTKENIRFVTLLRGVLMGDPLTKVFLHILNIVCREFGQYCLDPEFWQSVEPSVFGIKPRETTRYKAVEKKSPPRPRSIRNPPIMRPTLTEDAKRLQMRDPKYFVGRPMFSGVPATLVFKEGQPTRFPIFDIVSKPIEMLTKDELKRRKMRYSITETEFYEPLEFEETSKEVFETLTGPKFGAVGVIDDGSLEARDVIDGRVSPRRGHSQN
jgi:hypothetical protein